MIEYFKIKNYKSYKDEAILYMTPVTSLKEKGLENNILNIDSEYKNIKSSNNQLLKIASISGQNASGKSNLIKAFEFMRGFVMNSEIDFEDSKSNNTDNKVSSFMYSDKKESSEFELAFIIEGVRYRYGFILDNEEIIEEWLYVTEKGREKQFFQRKFNKLHLSNKDNIDQSYMSLAEKTLKEKKYSLALTLLYKTFGVVGLNSELKKVFQFFAEIMVITNEIYFEAGDRILYGYFNGLSDEIFDEQKGLIVEFIKSLDTGISDIEFKINHSSKKTEIYTIHNSKDKKIEIKMPLEQESSGTQKLIYASVFILTKLLVKNSILIIDELDNRIHTNLFIEIIRLFQKSNSQFIFATHNSFIMEQDLLRRDQIYFVDKNDNEESSLFSLSDFKNLKKDYSYQKRYLNGNYGAVPFVNFDNLEKLLFPENKEAENNG